MSNHICRKTKFAITLIVLASLTIPQLATLNVSVATNSGQSLTRLIENLAPKLDLLMNQIPPIKDAAMELTFDSLWQEKLISVTWDFHQNFIEVQADPETMEIRFFCNTALALTHPGIEPNGVDQNIWNSVFRIMDRLPEFADCLDSEGAVFVGQHSLSYGHVLEWHHYYKGIQIKDDFIRLVLDTSGKHVISLSKCWHTVSNLDISDYNIDVIDRTGQLYSKNQDTEKLIVIVNKEPRLAIRISSGSDVYIIDAVSGEILTHDYFLGYLDSYRGWEVDQVYPPTSGSQWEKIQQRFKASLADDEQDLARFIYLEDDVTREAILGQLENEKVFFFNGHGHEEWHNGLLYTRLYTSSTSLMPYDVSSKNLNNMYLAFLAACLTSATSIDGVSVYKNIAQGFLDGGAKCVIGFNNLTMLGYTSNLAKYFFDKAINNEYSFWDCLVYAKEKVP